MPARPSHIQLELQLMHEELKLWSKSLSKSQNPRLRKMATDRVHSIKRKLDDAKILMQTMYFIIYDSEKLIEGVDTSV